VLAPGIKSLHLHRPLKPPRSALVLPKATSLACSVTVVNLVLARKEFNILIAARPARFNVMPKPPSDDRLTVVGRCQTDSPCAVYEYE
jgi:hypothetical protein